MSVPAVPLSEHAAQASASFARLIAEAEGTSAGKEEQGSESTHITTHISEPLESGLRHASSSCTGKHVVYQRPYLLQFKDRYTDRPKGLPTSGLDCLPDQRHDSRPFRKGHESSRDLATLRLQRGRRIAGAAADVAGGRAGSPYPPGYSPPIGVRRQAIGAASPTGPTWRRAGAGEPASRETGGPRLVHKPKASISAPTTPRMWKRAPESVGVGEEEDFDIENAEEEEAKWGRRRPEGETPLSGGAEPDAKVWAPRRRQGTLSKDQEILSQVKGILNKLAVDNFHQLCGRLFELEIPSVEVLKGVVDVIFDKATLEPTFCSLYAQMCTDWVNKAPKFKEPGSDRDMTLRRALLNRCQEMFEKKEGAVIPNKRVMIGNVIFIGELYRKKLITQKIIHICLSKLLDSVTSAIANKGRENGGRPMDEDVECMCKLFIIVGRDLDMLSSDSRKRMDDYFRALRGIMVNKSLPARVRYLVQDVIEFRQAGWIPKTAKSVK